MTPRPSAWLAGAGLGICLACSVGLVASLLGVELPLEVYLRLSFGGLGLTVALDFALALVRIWQLAGADLESTRARAKQLMVSANATAWALRQSQHAAHVASGQAGAREAEAKERAWTIGAETFFMAGQKAGGFSSRKLAGCVGSDTHPLLAEFYASPAGLGVLRKVPGNVGYTWGLKDTGEPWTLAEVLTLIRSGGLPHPEGECPEIKPLPPSAAQRNTAQRAAEVVIEQ